MSRPPEAPSGERRIELRRFLYLDDDFVSDLLAQLDEGEYDEYRYQQASSSNRELGGKVGVHGIGLTGSGERRSEDQVTFIRRLTPASRVARLVRLLRDGGGLRERVVPGELSNGDFVLTEATVRLTGLTRLSLGFGELERSQRLFRRPRDSGTALTRGWRRLEAAARGLSNRPRRSQYRDLARMAAEMEGKLLPILVTIPPDGGEFQVLARLVRRSLRVEQIALEGNRRILFKISSLTKPGQLVPAAEPFPIAKPLQDAFFDGLDAGTRGHQVGHFSLEELIGPLRMSNPGATASLIAIYD